MPRPRIWKESSTTKVNEAEGVSRSLVTRLAYHLGPRIVTEPGGAGPGSGAQGPADLLVDPGLMLSSLRARVRRTVSAPLMLD